MRRGGGVIMEKGGSQCSQYICYTVWLCKTEFTLCLFSVCLSTLLCQLMLFMCWFSMCCHGRPYLVSLAGTSRYGLVLGQLYNSMPTYVQLY